jgi:hypothetical protein
MSINLTERQEQEIVIGWARSLEGKYPKLSRLHCSLNGVWLPPKLANQAKCGGMVSGVPDLQLPVPMKVGEVTFHALWIEMKSMDGVLSANQKRWLAELTEDGYAAICCKGAKAAITAIANYMNISKEDRKLEWL